MGHRMELYVHEHIAGEIISISQSFGIEARIVGRCEAFNGKKLTISTEKEVFEY
jgi:phosphoribosylformylglycinamidine cyclo-ligase